MNRPPSIRFLIVRMPDGPALVYSPEQLEKQGVRTDEEATARFGTDAYWCRVWLKLDPDFGDYRRCVALQNVTGADGKPQFDPERVGGAHAEAFVESWENVRDPAKWTDQPAITVQGFAEIRPFLLALRLNAAIQAIVYRNGESDPRFLAPSGDSSDASAPSGQPAPLQTPTAETANQEQPDPAGTAPAQ
jgi:hypothetical protein